MAHPWMTMDIQSNTSLSNAKVKLEKYLSIRKEKSYKNKPNDQADVAEDDDEMEN